MTGKPKKPHFLKRVKVFFITCAIAASGFIAYSFEDNYFEISKNLDILSVLFRELNIYYVDETQPGDLMKKGIDSMLESLDPYTTYIPESDIEDYRFMVSGEYGGIGALILQQNDYVYVSEPYEGFAAYKAGVKAGDKILEIDGIDVKGKSTSEVSKILKGQAGTEVKLLIERHNHAEPIEKVIVREEIKIPNVPYYGMIDSVTGYIKLNSFTETASKEVKDAFKELKSEKGMKKLVFDLRNNGGGLLREAVEIVNFFVPKGELVVKTKGKIKEWDREHKALNQPIDTEIPIVMLVNGGTASASEIVSGAIQDMDRGVVIGTQTFGKGLVQQTRNLSYNSKLKLTIAKYYIPSGRCIQKLDYSHRNRMGEVNEVPDSLISAFKTRNGRTVYDGRGVMPDKEVENGELPKILHALANRLHIFNYATEYYYTHDTIPVPDQFVFSDADYNNFVDYLKDKDYEYSTETEEYLKKLKKAAEREKYFKHADEEYEALSAKLVPDKKDDLMQFKDEISEILRLEIVSRYYYQQGKTISSLKNDPYVDQAKEVLHNHQEYNSILAKVE